MSSHKELTGVDAHTPFKAKFADAAARTAHTAVADDIDKVFWQQDDDTLWVIKSIAPTVWANVGGSAGSFLSKVIKSRPADQATREALAITADDIDQLFYQVDTNALWTVDSVGPVVWRQLTSGDLVDDVGGGSTGWPDLLTASIAKGRSSDIIINHEFIKQFHNIHISPDGRYLMISYSAGSVSPYVHKVAIYPLYDNGRSIDPAIYKVLNFDGTGDYARVLAPTQDWTKFLCKGKSPSWTTQSETANYPAWDTWANVGEFVTDASVTAEVDGYISPNGLKAYILGKVAGLPSLSQYDLAAANDLDTAHLNELVWHFTTMGMPSAIQDYAVRSITFHPDGQLFYLCLLDAINTAYIVKFEMTTAWAMHTANYLGHRHWSSTIHGMQAADDTNEMYQFRISPDGKKLYVASEVADEIRLNIYDVEEASSLFPQLQFFVNADPN